MGGITRDENPGLRAGRMGVIVFHVLSAMGGYYKARQKQAYNAV